MGLDVGRKRKNVDSYKRNVIIKKAILAGDAYTNHKGEQVEKKLQYHLASNYYNNNNNVTHFLTLFFDVERNVLTSPENRADIQASRF